MKKTPSTYVAYSADGDLDHLYVIDLGSTVKAIVDGGAA